jgi:hypothetical protein
VGLGVECCGFGGQREDLVEADDRVGVAGLQREQGCPAHQPGGEVRVDRQRAVAQRDGLIHPAEGAEDSGLAVERVDGFWIEPQRALVVGEGVVEAAHAAQRVTGVDQGIDVVRP